MRVAAVISKDIEDDVSNFLPEETTELIISGDGALGVERWADMHMIPKLVVRSDEMIELSPDQTAKITVELAETVIAVWSGGEDDVKLCIEWARRLGKPLKCIRSPGCWFKTER